MEPKIKQLGPHEFELRYTRQRKFINEFKLGYDNYLVMTGSVKLTNTPLTTKGQWVYTVKAVKEKNKFKYPLGSV